MADSQPAGETVASATMSGKQPVIHVVDDDASFRTAAMRLLRAAGYEACGHGSVSEFLAAGAADGAGCVLADLRMPGQSGLDLQQMLRENGNPVPIIFLTAHGDIPTTVRAMRHGAVDFLTKPIKKEPLFRAVERALARGTERAALHEAWQTLTVRESEVLTHVIGGKLNKQIAFDLEISERTVKAHRASIMKKLCLESVADLVRFAEALEIEPAR